MSEIDPHNEEHADGIVEDREQAPPVYFNILYFGLIIWAVIFMAWFLFSGWSSHDEFEEKMAAHTGTPPAMSETDGPASSVTGVSKVETPVSTNAEGAAVAASDIDAGAVFAEKCAGCHGAKGEGAFGPDLTSDSYKYGRERAMVVESIVKGRPKSMPAFADKLSQSEIDALTSYILDL